MNLEAIKKAAEEPTRDGYVLLDPATVLELIRLAEIGERVERDAEKRKQYAEAHPDEDEMK